MKRSLGWVSLAASLWFSPGWGLQCSEDKEYPLLNKKCCQQCPAGEELVKRCTDASPTKCEQCDDDHYNDRYTTRRCILCTKCNHDRGLQEIRPCQKTSDTVCACRPGHAPEGREEEKRCRPCPSGYFSLGGNEECRPWTNCTAVGRKTLQSGKQDMDTICDKPSGEIPTRAPVTQPTPFPKKAGVSTLMTQDSSPTVVPTNSGQFSGFLWILISFVLLLPIAGCSAFLVFHRRMKRKKVDILCNGIHAVPGKEETDYRIPIQEQEAGDKSNFVQG